MADLLNFNYLKQWDPRWRDVLLGGSNLTIGLKGCTTTCLSMGTELLGTYLLPNQIATNKKNYDSAGNMIWSALNLTGLAFRWREGNMLSKNPNTVNIEVVKAWLPNHTGRICLLEVAGGTHWILGLWWDDVNQDILAVDPATGQTCLAMKTYGPIVGASLFVKGKNTNRQQPMAPLYN